MCYRKIRSGLINVEAASNIWKVDITILYYTNFNIAQDNKAYLLMNIQCNFLAAFTFTFIFPKFSKLSFLPNYTLTVCVVQTMFFLFNIWNVLQTLPYRIPYCLVSTVRVDKCFRWRAIEFPQNPKPISTQFAQITKLSSIIIQW